MVTVELPSLLLTRLMAPLTWISKVGGEGFLSYQTSIHYDIQFTLGVVQNCQHYKKHTQSAPKADHRSTLASLRLRNRGNWKTQAHTGRLVVDYVAHSKNIRVSDQLGALGRQRIHVHVTGDWTQSWVEHALLEQLTLFLNVSIVLEDAVTHRSK